MFQTQSRRNPVQPRFPPSESTDARGNLALKSLITPPNFEDIENLSLPPQVVIEGCVAVLS
jgi:hypothetical protein